MHYSDYKNSRDATWHILIDLDVRELPIKVVSLCNRIGVEVKYTRSPNISGEAQIVDEIPVILVSKFDPPERQRFTIAHELGHILLGHVGKYPLVNREPSPSDNPIEQAANVFASRLLSPACVLWGCRVRSPEEIAKLCRISMGAARYRWERMQILYDRGKFLTSPLERKVFAQFLPYIRNNRL